ncbi:MAG TPA: hypothetical protein VMU33_10340 [Burkholderiaceae bacterium]|nr:hypothetical protein [Burkholderiaceae bacterium]
MTRHRLVAADRRRRAASGATSVRALALAAMLAGAQPAGAHDDARGGVPIGPLDVVVETGPCAGSLVVRTGDGRRFEVESWGGIARRRHLRVEGIVYRAASICGRYPWLRLRRDAPGDGATADTGLGGVARPGADALPRIALDRSIPRVLARVARLGTERAEAGLPFHLLDALQLEFGGSDGLLRRLARALAAWIAGNLDARLDMRLDEPLVAGAPGGDAAPAAEERAREWLDDGAAAQAPGSDVATGPR